MAGSKRPPSPIAPIALKTTDLRATRAPINEPTARATHQEQPIAATAAMNERASISGALRKSVRSFSLSHCR